MNEGNGRGDNAIIVNNQDCFSGNSISSDCLKFSYYQKYYVQGAHVVMTNK